MSSEKAVSEQAVQNGRAELPVRSPCVSICALDDNDICVGCFRTGLEIAGWGGMTNDEKRQVLARVAEREAASGRVL